MRCLLFFMVCDQDITFVGWIHGKQVAKGDTIMSSLREIGRDLFNIEVNTIEKRELTARKMPPLPHALLDIADTYLHELAEKLNLESFWRTERKERPKWCAEFSSEGGEINRAKLRVDTGPETFDKLRWAATRALRTDAGLPEDKKHFDDAERVILYRIRRNCDQLKNIIYDLREKDDFWKIWLDNKTRLELLDKNVRHKPMGEMSVDYAVTVRKIWDIGVEKVLIQTVIQIDGDVITRIQSDMDEDKRKRMLDVHQRSVDVSLSHWRTMFDIVKQIVGSLTELFGLKHS